jgi:hypothetical protein
VPQLGARRIAGIGIAVVFALAGEQSVYVPAAPASFEALSASVSLEAPPRIESSTVAPVRLEQDDVARVRDVPVPRGEIERLIYAAAKKYGIDPERFLAIAKCESGLRPVAYNRRGCEGFGCLGLFQHHARYWALRARHAGYEHDGNWRDPVVNASVAAWMIARGGGWGHWAACDRTTEATGS